MYQDVTVDLAKAVGSAVPRDLEGVEIGDEHHGMIDVVAVEVQDVPTR